MRVKPFQGLRPTPDSVGSIVSLPYDVVTTDEARAIVEKNPLSILSIVRAEVNFPAGISPYDDRVYAKAVENFLQRQQDGQLVRESEPSLYVYRQQMGSHVQTGIAAVCHVDDYNADLIKKHEKTRVDKENDRTRLTSDMAANAGPVFLTYRDQPELLRHMESVVAGQPLFDLKTEDGIRHTVWSVGQGGCIPIVEAFKQVPCFYVADGHHRAASAARVGRERREANPNHTGEEDYNWFMTVLFPASHLQILPYNRVVLDWGDSSPAMFRQALEKISQLEKVADGQSGQRGDFRMYLDGQWYRFNLTTPADASPAAALDVSLLQDQVLAPLLGIDDPRTSERIEFAGGIRGNAYLQDAVDGGRGVVAFSLYPVEIGQLMAISDAGQIMPPKSTWFEPKLRSGFFIHTFEPAGFKG